MSLYARTEKIFTLKIVKESGKIALVVGTALNLINQYSAILGHEPVVWWQVLMNYVVPFSVASYSALQQRRRDVPMAQKKGATRE
ncbi:hypothetical protein ACR0ST_04490 [Aliidiomarina sp. Khilg15.8]